MLARQTIVSPAELAELLARAAGGRADLDGAGRRLSIIDTRWTLGQPGAGRAAWRTGRIPGARFLDVDRDLSRRSTDAREGRHPLPDPDELAAALAREGVGASSAVVAYDDAGGVVAARLWWLLRWIGHDEVAVLDGGLAAWTAAGGPLDRSPPGPAGIIADPIAPRPDAARIASHEEVGRAVETGLRGESPAIILLDARAPERYRGETEPVDPRPGHIPTARSAPAAHNLGGDPAAGFLSPAALRERYQLLGVVRGDEVVCYCGSGVTACHDVLALELAGLRGARLYPGSYSAWSSHPGLPVVSGDSP